MLSPAGATRAALEQIEKRDRPFNAFIIVCADEALTAAKESEAHWRQGKPNGLVDVGTPSIKGVLLMKGHPIRRGSLTSSDVPGWERADGAQSRRARRSCRALQHEAWREARHPSRRCRVEKWANARRRDIASAWQEIRIDSLVRAPYRGHQSHGW
jgi:hypothetical protein